MLVYEWHSLEMGVEEQYEREHFPCMTTQQHEELVGVVTWIAVTFTTRDHGPLDIHAWQGEAVVLDICTYNANLGREQV